MERIKLLELMNAGVHRMEANLAKAHNMFLSADLFHSQNACVHSLV